MKIKDIIDNYYFETLNDNHDLSDFDCGDDDLNDFLKNDALVQQNANLNVTKLVMYNQKIVGFVTLLTDTIPLRNIRNEKVTFNIKDLLWISSKNRLISAVKNGRLAVDKRYSGANLETHILRNIISNLKIISKRAVGFRFLIVEGYARAFNLYVVKNGFEYLKKDDSKIKNIDFIDKEIRQKNFTYISI